MSRAICWSVLFAWPVAMFAAISAGGAAPLGDAHGPFSPGHRYPLVIQTHGFPRNKFFRVGYYSETANAEEKP
jgi:hypothetical protein